MNTPAPSFAGCRLLVATPMYDGAQGTYVRAAMALMNAASAAGLAIDFAFTLHQPSINRARNMLIHQFLRGSFTHMLFIDSDITFDADEVLGMVRAMLADPRAAILGAPVARRMINWPTVAAAASAGLGKEDPKALAQYSGDFALAFARPGEPFRLDELVELNHLGTGLMAIRRDVAETLAARHPELVYRPDVEEQRGYGLGEEVSALFMPLIEPETRRMLSDDYAFCRRARDAGFGIYLAPWMRTAHTGPATFAGSLADLAPLFAIPANQTNTAQ